MFRRTLKRIVVGLGLTAALLGSAGCNEEVAKAAVEASMRTVDEGATRFDGSDIDPFVVALDIPFYIR